jgi:catechol 2,3-dioxygenase-like lactoylglutathione lyase family enzyme
MNDKLRFLGIGQVARSVANVKETERWYRDVLNLDHLFTIGNLTFFDCAGMRLMFSQAEHEPGDESLIYFRVEDIHAAYERLTSRGVVFINTPHMVHKHDDDVEEWMAFFKDPEGRPLALLSTIRSHSDR